MLTSAKVVFLLDVDNALLDNDRFGADLTTRLDRDFGEAERRRYWTLYDTRRRQLGYADYLGALQSFGPGIDNLPALLRTSEFLLDYPFSQLRYPGATTAIEHLRAMGATVILSDGDIVFQPRKIQRSGLWNAVESRVLVYPHKELALDDVQRRFPAGHYVMIDDKPQLLAAMKQILAGRLTTVFVRQGHYALDPGRGSTALAPDVTIDRIGDLCGFGMDRFRSFKPSRALTPVAGEKEIP